MRKSWNIMQAAREVGCTVSTLLWYERTRQLQPRTLANGTRIYSPDDIRTAKAIHNQTRRRSA